MNATTQSYNGRIAIGTYQICAHTRHDICFLLCALVLARCARAPIPQKKKTIATTGLRAQANEKHLLVFECKCVYTFAFRDIDLHITAFLNLDKHSEYGIWYIRFYEFAFFLFLFMFAQVAMLELSNTVPFAWLYCECTYICIILLRYNPCIHEITVTGK